MAKNFDLTKMKRGKSLAEAAQDIDEMDEFEIRNILKEKDKEFLIRMIVLMASWVQNNVDQEDYEYDMDENQEEI